MDLQKNMSGLIMKYYGRTTYPLDLMDFDVHLGVTWKLTREHAWIVM
jgi:hypothetical protein